MRAINTQGTNKLTKKPGYNKKEIRKRQKQGNKKFNIKAKQEQDQKVIKRKIAKEN